jgi:hypothetical protein
MTNISTEEILIDMACLDRGLIPVGANPHASMHSKLNAAFESMNSHDARKAKRKYRKYFRKAVAWKIREFKKMIATEKELSGRTKRELVDQMHARTLISVGLMAPDGRPIDASHKRRRRLLVIDYLAHQAMTD